MKNARAPEDLYPNLFGKKKPQAKATPLQMKADDMRLLQWSMRNAARRSASAGKRPSPAARS